MLNGWAVWLYLFNIRLLLCCIFMPEMSVPAVKTAGFALLTGPLSIAKPIVFEP